VGTLLWLIASLTFRWYVSAFANYQKTYGAIGAAIVTLLWFYLSGLAMLIGAEMNAVIEHASPLGKYPAKKVSEPVATGDPPRPPALPAAVRPTHVMIGGAVLAIEMAAIVFWHLHRFRHSIRDARKTG
jgi:hypothetical protein